ncbi:hypothetical protein E4631_15360 [Hymenobacter sp. UV11]|nr:hypothetical protein A8B98_18865 [Hymenobacter sp. UV11]TFZ65598.1 hypothetical protein E4631_15360 [Hymenobacter sp. UV11]
MLARLTATHHLDRADILTRCLLALRRDFRRPLLTWFKELFVSLQPTRAERLARQAELTELLAHPLPLVVNLAIEQLKDVWPEPGFALAPLLHYADTLLLRPDLKTGLKTLLAGLAKLPRQDAAHAPAVARLLAAALAHPDATVQERAAKGLADLLAAKKPLLPPADTTETLATLADQAELLGAAARTALAPWLAAPTPAPAADAPAAYAPRTQFVPDISPATAIAPVADWHELLFLTGQVLRHDAPAALERWLDGLLRLHEQLPEGYAAQLEPYLVQALPFLQGKSGAQAEAILAGNSTQGHAGLAEALLLSWHAGFRRLRVAKVPLLGRHLASDPLVTLEQQRLSFAEELLHRGISLPLLSTPSHAPYWVTPTALIIRLLAYEQAQQEPNAADLVVALARTAHAYPAEAEAALTKLPELRHEGLRELLHWLLSPDAAALPATVGNPKSLLRQFTERLARLLPGAVALPSSITEALPWLWAVAARTKYPEGNFPELTGLTPNACPGVVQPWQPRWELQAQAKSYVDKWKPGQPTITERWTKLRLLPAGAPGALPNSLLLYSAHATQLLTQQPYWHQLALAFEYPFLQALLPHYPAPLQWHALRVAAVRNEADATSRDILTQALHGLLLPGTALDEPASLLLAVGLVHYAPTCRALAQEVLLAAVVHQRLVPTALGRALGQLLAADYAPVARLADALPQLRAISPEADDALRQTLDVLLPELPALPPRNLRKLLEAYADLVARTGRAVPPAVQGRLADWSQTATLKKITASLRQPV